MGLNTTHDCWHGSYTGFGEFRREVAKAAGLKLEDMLGFGGILEFNPADSITILLNHSDCDGEITWEAALPLADRMVELVANINEAWIVEYVDFIFGLRRAYALKENVLFR